MAVNHQSCSDDSFFTVKCCKKKSPAWAYCLSHPANTFRNSTLANHIKRIKGMFVKDKEGWFLCWLRFGCQILSHHHLASASQFSTHHLSSPLHYHTHNCIMQTWTYCCVLLHSYLLFTNDFFRCGNLDFLPSRVN